MAVSCRSPDRLAGHEQAQTGDNSAATVQIAVIAVVEEYWPDGYKDELLASTGREQISDLVRLKVVSPAASRGHIIRLVLDKRNRTLGPFLLLTHVGARVRFTIDGRVYRDLDGGPLEATVLGKLEMDE